MGTSTTEPTALTCPDCGRTYSHGPGEPWRCQCGHALEFVNVSPPDGSRPISPDLDRDRGLWAFESLLPVSCQVTLGEGWTPLLEAPAWDASFKLEYLFPSGSFKDRGATTTISRALELGVDHVVEDSSGNAGSAIAQYAARAGIDAEIYVPASVSESKRRAIETTGADIVAVDGSRADVTRAVVETLEERDAWYASHAWNPAFFAGTKTFALELAVQRGWEAPDAVVLPVGHGTLALGTYRGFAELNAADWLESMPRMIAVEAAGYATLADEDQFGEENDVAEGIHIREPAREEQIQTAIEKTGGTAIAIGAERTRQTMDRLHQRGFIVGPTSAVAPAALEPLRERNVLSPASDVVVPLTGRS